MLLRILFCSVALLSLSVFADADVRRGNCPPNGRRSFSYIPNADGPSEVTMIFDSPNSDLDILVGTEIQGDTVLVCQGVSTLKQFERCVFGADDALIYTIVVDSFRGGSPFRIYVGTNSNETVTTAGRAASSSLVEVDYRNRVALKMIEMAKTTRKLKRK